MVICAKADLAAQPPGRKQHIGHGEQRDLCDAHAACRRQCLTKDFDDLRDNEERQRVDEQVERIMENHPNNPYPGAVLLGLYAAEREWGDSSEEVGLAQWLVPIAQRSNDLFAALIPKGFRGQIEPKLIGNWVENYSYFSALYFGGVAADIAGKPAVAKKWWRASVKACRSDPFGASFALGASFPHGGDE